MNQKEEKPQSEYRVYADRSGKVFLKLEPAGISEEIKRPVTPTTLEIAKSEVKKQRIENEDREKEKHYEELTKAQAEAQKEIETALHPIRKGPWLSKISYIGIYLLIRIILLVGSAVLIAFVYAGVQASSANLPGWLHAIVLLLYIVGLATLVYFIGTEENRGQFRTKIIAALGPWGMVILPILILLTTSAVLASITFRLYDRGWIVLEACSGRPISEPALRDFYVWHFINIVPTLQLTKLLRMNEPFCYSQSRVGILIFIFQLFVVIPSFNSVRFYWKHRKQPGFVYDPLWNPPLK